MCVRSKESSRYKAPERTERPVRNVNSLKRDFNCLAFISAHFGERDCIDVEFLDYHTCCKDEVSLTQLRLSRTIKRDIEIQLDQGLTVDRIVKNMTAKFDSRNDREQMLQVRFRI